jgi:hypothetical protein
MSTFAGEWVIFKHLQVMFQIDSNRPIHQMVSKSGSLWDAFSGTPGNSGIPQQRLKGDSRKHQLQTRNKPLC